MVWRTFFISKPESCTAALLLDIDLIKLKRGPSASSFALASYVNDRPELVETQNPLKVRFSALLCRGGERLLRELFEPLGYSVEARGRCLTRIFRNRGRVLVTRSRTGRRFFADSDLEMG